MVYQPPTADAGPDQIANEFAAVTLNGSNSNDPDDGIASFYWEQIDGPFVDLADQRDEVISFTAPEGTAEGTSLTFNLTVSDYSGLQSQDSCTVTVKPVSNETADTVKITKALYKTAYEKLTVKATSDAPAKSVVLTVWADFDGTEVELGNLRYDGIKKLYIKVFKRLNLIPDSITVESSGGGIDTQPAVIK